MTFDVSVISGLRLGGPAAGAALRGGAARPGRAAADLRPRVVRTRPPDGPLPAGPPLLREEQR